MEMETWNPYGDGPLNDDELDGYMRWQSNLHEYQAGPDFGKCIAPYYLKDGKEIVCNASSHSTTHLPLPCCHCKHGVYLHTSYDIPCGTCEAEASGDYDE